MVAQDRDLAEHPTFGRGLLLALVTNLAIAVATIPIADHWNARGGVAVTDRLLAFIDGCLREGNEYVINAVAVSFVEDFGVYPGESDALLARWPPALRAELGR